LACSAARDTGASREELIDIERESAAPPKISGNGNHDEGGDEEEGEVCAQEIHITA
jgi:hypothetical protein